jgi:SdrD B-like domain
MCYPLTVMAERRPLVIVAGAGPPAKLADPDGEILYTKNVPANINRNPYFAGHDLTGTGVNSATTSTWCTFGQFGAGACPTAIGEVTGYFILPRKTAGDHPGQLDPGNLYSVVVSVLPSGNATGNVYTNDFIGDSPSLTARPAGSNIVSTRVVAPDIVTTKSVTPTTITAGQAAVFTITVKNNTGGNTGPIENVAGTVIRMTDTLTTPAVIASAADVSGTDWNCSASAAPATVSCLYTGTLPLGIGAVVGGPITINASIPTNALSVTGIVNTATASMTGQVESPSSNNASTATFAVVGLPVPVSGTVFNDANGLTDTFVNGAGSNAGSSTLTAYLVSSAGTITASSAVAANGAYSFPAAPQGTGYKVVLSNTAGATGAATGIIRALPAGWVSTGEVNGSATTAHSEVGAAIANGESPSFDAVGAGTVVNINFGIEQIPTATAATALAVQNPGGTVDFTVPSTDFLTKDPEDTAGVDASMTIRITALPANADSITVAGVKYGLGGAAFPAAGVVVSVANLGLVKIDPKDNVASVLLPYVAVDAAGKESSVVNLTLPLSYLSLSGSIFDDANGDGLMSGTEAGVVGLTAINAILVNSSGNVVASTPISAAGAYSFNNLQAGATYTVMLSTNAATVGSAAPAIALPSNWVVTNESSDNVTADLGLNAGDGKVTLTMGVANKTGVNLGIDQLPTAAGYTHATSQTNPAGTANIAVPSNAFLASDPEDSPSGATPLPVVITVLPSNATSITIDGVTYGAGAGQTPFPAVGVTVPVAKLGSITFDPKDGVSSVSIAYKAMDAAGKLSGTSANAVFNLVGVSLTGMVFNDTNGNGLMGGTETGVTALAVPLYVHAVDGSGKVVAVAAISAAGSYSFTNLQAGNTYDVVISTTQGVVGGATPAVAVPTGWVLTNESADNLSADLPANAGDGKVTITLAATGSAGVNLGIERPPTAGNSTQSAQANPGGTNAITVPVSAFNNALDGSTDPDAAQGGG